jgi:hypothetical protein
MMRVASLVMLLLAFAPAAVADDAQHEANKAKLKQIVSQPPPAADAKSVDPAAPLPPPVPDPQTRALYLSAMREYYAYCNTRLQHRRSVFGWQLLSAKIIFVAVLLLVFSGIYFAAVQFYSGLKTNAAPQTTEIVASMKEVKVTSPVLGVIILVISLAFFYCYLVYVYPIADIF